MADKAAGRATAAGVTDAGWKVVSITGWATERAGRGSERGSGGASVRAGWALGRAAG